MSARIFALAFVLAAATVGGCGGGGERDAPAPPAARAVASPNCSAIAYGGEGKPELLIVVMTSLQGLFRDHGVQTAQAVKLVLEGRGWRAGRYRVGVQSCDETSAGSDFADLVKCRETGAALAGNRSVVAVVGPQFSGCSAELLQATKRSPARLALVNASSTYLGLTRPGPGVGEGEPAKYRHNGRPSFIRVVPADDIQGAAAAMYAAEQGAKRPYVLTHRDAYGRGLGEAFSGAATKLGLAVEGPRRWNPKARDYRRLAARVARGGADSVFLSGYAFENAPRLIRDLRDAMPDALLIGPDGMNNPGEIVEGAQERAEGFVSTIAVVPARKLPAAGRQFAEEFRRRHEQYPCCFSVGSAQAALMALDAIAEAGPDREGITERLLEARVEDGLLGDFEIDRFGDTTLTRIGVYRITDGKTRFVGTVSPQPRLLDHR